MSPFSLTLAADSGLVWWLTTIGASKTSISFRWALRIRYPPTFYHLMDQVSIFMGVLITGSKLYLHFTVIIILFD